MLYAGRLNEFIKEKVKDKIVLSIGCAGLDDDNGSQAIMLDEFAKDWYGFDNNQEYLNKNKEKKVTYVDLNKDWDIKIKEVEIVIFSEVLEHLESPIQTLINIKKNFPNRKFIASVPNGASLGKILLAATGHKLYLDQDRHHLMMFNPKTIENTFRAAGIKEFSISFHEFRWYFIPIVKICSYLSNGLIIEGTL